MPNDAGNHVVSRLSAPSTANTFMIPSPSGNASDGTAIDPAHNYIPTTSLLREQSVPIKPGTDSGSGTDSVPVVCVPDDSDAVGLMEEDVCCDRQAEFSSDELVGESTSVSIWESMTT